MFWKPQTQRKGEKSSQPVIEKARSRLGKTSGGVLKKYWKEASPTSVGGEKKGVPHTAPKELKKTRKERSKKRRKAGP